jgi:hypothetical protein
MLSIRRARLAVTEKAGPKKSPTIFKRLQLSSAELNFEHGNEKIEKKAGAIDTPESATSIDNENGAPNSNLEKHALISNAYIV